MEESFDFPALDVSLFSQAFQDRQYCGPDISFCFREMVCNFAHRGGMMVLQVTKNLQLSAANVLGFPHAPIVVTITVVRLASWGALVNQNQKAAISHKPSP